MGPVSTLHEQLLARIDRGDPYQLITAWKALRAVVERHKPVPCRMARCATTGHVLCAGCGHGQNYSECPDTLAIAEALGVQIGETP